jgi:DNA-binding NarL/FixJ family response regulator
MSNPAIATALSLSVRTIERHIENLYRKLDVHGRADATAWAFRHDLI